MSNSGYRGRGMKIVRISMTISIWISLFFSSFSFATLGEQASVNATAATSSKKILSQVTYNIQESIVNGITVREFVLPSGVVFAVTWRGIKHPDLSQVLGNYHAEYEKLNNQKVKAVGRAPIHVSSSKVSVKMSGHMRDVRGEAYDPSLLPAGFSIQDLK